MKNKPRFVIDTNVLLVSISKKSQYHWIFQGLLSEKFEIAFTTEILTEYEEIISLKYSPAVARNVIRTLLLLPNAVRTVVYYNWELIQHDKDDNKFVDCAVATNADAIITQDKHFAVLKDTPFPSIIVMNIFKLELFLKERNIQKSTE
ncbi:MAG: putative toxin-antitoxin system toxin component, PIN family [Candidatus Electrothrix sp. Rat3]|nr:putative toxin-antitoxin system toxin component, PIN family [Candidatus Electrothrix rattekaaiensis]